MLRIAPLGGLLALVGAACAGCGGQQSLKAEVGEVRVPPVPSSAAPRSAAPRKPEQTDEAEVLIPMWSVKLTVPRGAPHSQVGAEYRVELSRDVTVVLQQLSSTLGAADHATVFEALGFGTKRQVIIEGEANGVHYSARSYVVREGFRHGDTTIHRPKRVSRLFALLRLTSVSQLLCTAYIEFSVDASSPELVQALRLCSSLRGS